MGEDDFWQQKWGWPNGQTKQIFHGLLGSLCSYVFLLCVFLISTLVWDISGSLRRLFAGHQSVLKHQLHKIIKGCQWLSAKNGFLCSFQEWSLDELGAARWGWKYLWHCWFCLKVGDIQNGLDMLTRMYVYIYIHTYKRRTCTYIIISYMSYIIIYIYILFYYMIYIYNIL